MFARRIQIVFDRPPGGKDGVAAGDCVSGPPGSADQADAGSREAGFPQSHAVGSVASREAVPLRWLDSFAMRNFTNEAIFDDTLPVADGWMEVGSRVPLPALAAAMENWFRRKGWLSLDEHLRITEETLPLLSTTSGPGSI